VDEGSSAAASFGNRSGPLSGSSVISWDELVRQQASDSGDQVDLRNPESAVDFDPVSDQDLLREVLADEPPPSKIILKDPSGHEMPALPSKPLDAVRGPEGLSPLSSGSSGSFLLPPGLEASRPADVDDSTVQISPPAEHVDNSSVLGEPQTEGTGNSGLASDVWAEASHVDLLGAQPSDLSSGSLQRTDELQGPPIVRPPSEATLYDDGGSDAESSAVELGTEQAADLPFPLGIDSSVGSSVLRSGPPADAPEPDSGAVDLLNASQEFDLDLKPGGSSLTPGMGISTADLPPTVPMVPAGKGRAVAWAGGGAAGLLAGVAASAAFWYAGGDASRTAKSAAPSAADPALAPVLAQKTDAEAVAQRAADQAKQAQAKLDEVTAALKAASLDPANLPAATQRLAQTAEQARKDQEKLAQQVEQTRAAAEEAKQARTKLDDLTAQLRQAKLDPADLPAAIRQLADARGTADAAVKAADAQLAKMRGQIAQAQDEARAADARWQARVDQLAAAQRTLTGFMQDVTRRLQAARLVAPNAAPQELLAGLDKALQRRPDVPAAPAAIPAASYYSSGRTDYNAGDYYRAERKFAAAAGSGERNAVYYYFLGLSRLGLGRQAAADEAFRQGAALERQNLPNPGEVDHALERLPTASRQVVNAYRR
jgi:hypothetical protein